MKLFKKALLSVPLLAAASVAIPLASCSISPENSVSFEGDKTITTNTTSFELNLKLQYIKHAEQKFVLKIIDQSKSSIFTFKKEYLKHNVIGRRLEYTIDFEAQTYGSTKFNIEFYATTEGKLVWSSTIKDFTLIYKQ